MSHVSVKSKDMLESTSTSTAPGGVSLLCFLAKTMSLFTHESNWQYPRELFGKQTKCWWEGGTTCDGLASQGRGVGLLQVSSMLQKLVFIKSLEFK